jgi:thiol-disulfide isomerase/thioredoxin
MFGKPMNEILNDATTNYPEAPEIIPGGEWFNSAPLTINFLRGKVVLIDFWTYSCINCQRTFPYLRSWWEKYKDDGLVIIGVHTPEFEFEKKAENLKQAITDFELTYPIVQDNNYSTWRAYNNRFWPAKYLIDKEGRIRYTHFGEGAYDETESEIQKLLGEMGTTVDEPIDNPDYVIESRTPEIYLGAKRYNGTGYVRFTGDWELTSEYAESSAGATITLDFYSKDTFIVMRSDQPTRVKTYLDGKELESLTINRDKLYELVRLEEPGAHSLKLEFLDSGTQAFAFTFG